jgi:hypothetical protein
MQHIVIKDEWMLLTMAITLEHLLGPRPRPVALSSSTTTPLPIYQHQFLGIDQKGDTTPASRTRYAKQQNKMGNSAKRQHSLSVNA